MNPLLISALLSFAPSLLGGLFGDPQKTLRRRLNAMSSPGTLAAYTNQNYQNILQGPAYSSALGGIASGANATQNRLATELGARGLGTSGTGAVLNSLIPSIVSSQQGQLKTGAYGAAQSQAQQQIQQMIAALTGTSGPSQSQQLFAGGLEAFAPMLLQWLKSKYPNMGAVQ